MLDIDDLLRDMSIDINNTMSFETIQNEIRETLKNSGLSNDKVAEFSKKMDGYKQINNVFELQRGRHIRWMRTLSQPTNGAILIDIKFLDNGTYILCKNIMGKMFQIKYDDCIIFQKMTTDEIMIAYAVGKTY
jgi:hypothetical protein